MKKFIIPTLLASALLLTFSSCEDPIDVDIPEGKTLLVVDAFLTNQQSVQTVRLTTTSPYFSSTNTPPVAGASVSLSDLTSGKNFTFSDIGNGNYVFSPVAADSFGVVGHDYKLNVNWTGLSYEAFSTLKRTTTIDTLLFIKEEGGQGFEKGYYPYIYAFDSSGAKDFYWIKAYKNGVFFSEPGVINIAEDAGGGDGTDGLAFIPPNAYFGVTPSDQPFQLVNSVGVPDVCKIECYSLNKNTYEFLLQARTQMTNSSSGLFAVTPENTKSNIVPIGSAPKALGFFNMGSITTRVQQVAE